MPLAKSQNASKIIKKTKQQKKWFACEKTKNKTEKPNYGQALKKEVIK